MRTGNRDDADCISVPITRHNIFDGDSHPEYDQFALLDLIEFFQKMSMMWLLVNISSLTAILGSCMSVLQQVIMVCFFNSN